MIDNRDTSIELGKGEFKRISYQLIDTIATFIDTIEERPVTTGESPEQIQQLIGTASCPNTVLLRESYYRKRLIYYLTIRC